MKTTDQLINQIKASKEYKPVENRLEMNINQFLIEQLEGINRKVMFTQIDMDPRNGNKYINGERQVSRDILIKIFLYLQFELEDYNQVFKNFGYPKLYAKNKRDGALIYCIHNKYSYLETKRFLQQHKLELL
ncbi:hypothetical protein R2F61_02235 [Mollicutes bacterium LVI A0078]|nr:hypothetical protein RZE84_02265 [Mollicutes bacterium LVI A0075]WOO91387.1 hypothetical protein R2F61_02235 [Mollicutes bacterium LVI A0078]